MRGIGQALSEKRDISLDLALSMTAEQDQRIRGGFEAEEVAAMHRLAVNQNQEMRKASGF